MNKPLISGDCLTINGHEFVIVSVKKMQFYHSDKERYSKPRDFVQYNVLNKDINRIITLVHSANSPLKNNDLVVSIKRIEDVFHYFDYIIYLESETHRFKHEYAYIYDKYGDYYVYKVKYSIKGKQIKNNINTKQK